MQKRFVLTAALLLAACEVAPERTPERDSPDLSADDGVVPAASSATGPSVAAPAPGPNLLAEQLILAEWGKAGNSARCAPVAFASDGGKGGAPRRAIFAGGWSVAFDVPGERSAYGVAGTGDLPEDDASKAEQRHELIEQWPLFRDLSALPQPAFAGYGVEGAKTYPPDDPQVLDVNSLAYVRIGGQSCLYNVWSRLGRAHLELLLDNLRMVERPAN